MANYQGQYVFRKSDKAMLMWTKEGELSPEFTAIPRRQLTRVAK
ncbi:hypothetical protein [Pasteurella multocida]|nr:hypothetical protein [Pasteurella multocida]